MRKLALAASILWMGCLADYPRTDPSGTPNPSGTPSPSAAPTSPAMPTPAQSITQWGITWHFASPVMSGQFVNGDYWVIGPVTISGIDPPSEVAGGRTINGSMLNPAIIDPGKQGYDSGNLPERFDASLNVAQGVDAEHPLVIDVAGTSGKSLVSVISWTDAAPPASESRLKTAAVLTILPSAPPEGAFRPPYAGTDKTVRYTAAQIRWERVPSLESAQGAPALGDTSNKFARVWLDHMSGWPSRMLHPVENMPDYGRDFTSLYGTGLLVASSSAHSQAEKRELVNRLVQIGIDDWGNVQAGAKWEGVGGQGSGRKAPILFAGALLDDAAMLNMGTTHPSTLIAPGNHSSQFGEDAQTFYVEETSAGTYNWGFGGYGAAHVGIPEWGNGHTHATANDNVDWFADAYRRCCTANAWVGQTLVMRVMNLDDEWNHPAYFDYMDRYMTATSATGEHPAGADAWTRAWDPWQLAMWDRHR